MGGGQIFLISKVSETHFSVIYVFWALSISSATAGKRSRGDVFRRETVLSSDRRPNSLKSNYSHIFTRMNLIS